MDKLAMEEAGYCNCVSVPDGAPPKASPPDKDVPPEEQVCVSISFYYFDSCNYLIMDMQFGLLYIEKF